MNAISTDLCNVNITLEQLIENIRDYAIFMLNDAGHVVTWNPGAERIKGYTSDEIIGKHFSLFYTDEDRRVGEPERALTVARSQGRFESEGWRVRKDGSRFRANAVVNTIYDCDGAFLGFAKITRDISERLHTEYELEDCAHCFAALMNATTGIATFQLDESGRIITWNPATRGLTGYGAADVLGLHYSVTFTDEDQTLGTPEIALQLARRLGRYRRERWLIRRDGSRFLAETIVDPIVHAVGGVTSFAVVIRDLTQSLARQQGN